MRVAVVYAKFAPYHAARLGALAAEAKARGHEILAIEVASTQRDYQWARTGDPRGFQGMTLFPDADYWDLSYLRIRGALVRALDRQPPDVVVLPGWGFRESIAGLGWAHRNSAGTVLLSDSQPIDGPRSATRERVKRTLVAGFDTALVGGKPHTRYLRKLGMRQDRILPGCDVVDNAFFARAPRAPPLTPRIVSCLRLLPRKNVLGALGALAAVPEWEWVIVGDGPQRVEIERHIRDLGLGSRVVLRGHVPDDEIPALLAGADAYLQPSLSEPWGLAVNEAMAAGLPVLVSDRCGCREDLVQQGVNGFLFDPTKRESIVGALRAMLADRARWPEMGHASRKIIAGWDLGLYARNLLACAEAASALPRSARRGSWLLRGA